MPSINIRQLRDTRLLKTWLREGKTVELRERGRPLGRIVPEPGLERPQDWPDFAARGRKIFGDRIVAGADLVISERGRF
jgi:antitoxin (DNA-binding transcriptional repressor) of toxin-antitoxin stability system